MKLSQLTVPMVRRFEDQLRADRSPAMVRKVLGSLGAILADAQERGLVGAERRPRPAARRRRGKDRRADKRQRASSRSASISRHPEEIRAIVAHLGRALAAAVADRDLHRAARVGAARPALG